MRSITGPTPQGNTHDVPRIRLLCPLLGGGGGGGGGGGPDGKQPAVEFEAHLIHDSGAQTQTHARCSAAAKARARYTVTGACALCARQRWAELHSTGNRLCTA
jgi:hypothetical protein